MNSVWQITSKDLYLLVRDRRSFAVLLLLPLVFIAIIGTTTGKFLNLTSSNRAYKIAVIDQTAYSRLGPSGNQTAEVQRKLARNLIAKIYNRLQEQEGLHLDTVPGWRRGFNRNLPDDDYMAAWQLVDADDVTAMVVFGPGFHAAQERQQLSDVLLTDRELINDVLKRFDIEVRTDQPGSQAASTIHTAVYGALKDQLARITACRNNVVRVGVGRRACAELDAEVSQPPIALASHEIAPTESASNEVYQITVPSYTVMFVFFLVNIMARSFIHERDLGTMRRLRTAPVTSTAVMTGKTLPFLVVSLLQTATLFLAGKLLFQMSWGTFPWMLLPVIFATSCAATGLGLLIATLVKSDSQVSAYATTTVIVLAGISGCFMPRKWLPDVMQQISLATPHSWALIAYDQLLASPTPDLAVVWQCCAALIAFAVGFFLIGAWRFSSVD